MLRWRKNPSPTGFAKVLGKHPGFTLYKNRTIPCAIVKQLKEGGWYWIAGSKGGSMIPLKNTCDAPVARDYVAKEQAIAYVKQHLGE